MGSKTRLITFCTKRRENPANLVTSRRIKTTLARPIGELNKFESMLRYFKRVAIFRDKHYPKRSVRDALRICYLSIPIS